MNAILGISAYYHDSAAALVVDGRIAAAAQQERFSRVKHDNGFPSDAVRCCLDIAGIGIKDVDYVVFYEKPLLKFDRLLETWIAHAPRGFGQFLAGMPPWLRRKLFLRREMDRALGGCCRGRYVFTEHHESHAAAAFFPSPFDQAAILTMDGVGEWATAAAGAGRGGGIELLEVLRFPHSLGLLYSAFTFYAGFKVNSGEYKMMGLAPYGEPKYVDLILGKLVDLKQDGSFRLNMKYFPYCRRNIMIGRRFERLFGAAAREPEGPIGQVHMDAAASIQAVTEKIMLRAARHVHEKTGMKNLALSGGVALNCVANGRLLREGPFEKIWIQPAAGDAGGALGAALFVWYQLLGNDRRIAGGDSQGGSLLGAAYGSEEIRAFLDSRRVPYRRFENERELLEETTEMLAAGKIVGWFQGRMEFGPRALGSRSILADARVDNMQEAINNRVKFRERWRPFAPCVMAEYSREYFELNTESPYMLLVAAVSENKRLPVAADDQVLRGLDKARVKRSLIPAVTHVDCSARVQTVDAERHRRLHRLLAVFREKTGCAVLVNTSFNVRGEPIVRTPRDAYECFAKTGLDALVMEDVIIVGVGSR